MCALLLDFALLFNYYYHLTSEEDQDKELDPYESKERSFLELRKQVVE